LTRTSQILEILYLLELVLSISIQQEDSKHKNLIIILHHLL